MIKNYFNNCLTSQPAPEVIEAMLPYMKEKFFFPANFVLEGSEIEEDINSFKSAIAKTINAKPSEIHFTTGGTSANNIAIKGFISANYNKGNHIIVSVVDYPDLLTNAAFFEKSGTIGKSYHSQNHPFYDNNCKSHYRNNSTNKRNQKNFK